MKSKLAELANLLEHRVAVIADHELRDRDPSEQLQQLQAVSESITTIHNEVKPELDFRLNHFLTNCSYEKALEHIRGLLQNS